jgi:hypothetical protein
MTSTTGAFIEDLVIIRSGGSYEYSGTYSGVFKPDVWTTGSWKLGAVEIF